VPSVAFYISGHGFGHASRQIEIINAVATNLPAGWHLVVRSAAARWLFERTLRTRVTFVPGECDSGIVQLDSLRLDEAATARAAADFYATFEERLAAEARVLREHDTQFVLADAPPLACGAAAAVDIPCVVVSNFTWDWIYEDYAPHFATEAPEVLPLVRELYGSAGEGWRLPMHGGFATVPSISDLPFVARHATRPRDQVLRTLQIPHDKPVALTSFGGYGLAGLDLATLDCRERWTVLATGRAMPDRIPDGIAFVQEGWMYDRGLRYEDLVAAADVVVTKPGYGIISECVANDTAMLYTSRGRFREYDVLVREMPRVLRCQHLEQSALLAGRWLASLDTLLVAPPPPERPATDGANVAARRILERIEGAT
jgi:L-arabinokinase